MAAYKTPYVLNVMHCSWNRFNQHRVQFLVAHHFCPRHIVPCYLRPNVHIHVGLLRGRFAISTGQSSEGPSLVEGCPNLPQFPTASYGMLLDLPDFARIAHWNHAGNYDTLWTTTHLKSWTKRHFRTILLQKELCVGQELLRHCRFHAGGDRCFVWVIRPGAFIPSLLVLAVTGRQGFVEANVQKPLWKVPVVHCDERGDSISDELINQIVIELDPLLSKSMSLPHFLPVQALSHPLICSQPVIPIDRAKLPGWCHLSCVQWARCEATQLRSDSISSQGPSSWPHLLCTCGSDYWPRFQLLLRGAKWYGSMQTDTT